MSSSGLNDQNVLAARLAHVAHLKSSRKVFARLAISILGFDMGNTGSHFENHDSHDQLDAPKRLKKLRKHLLKHNPIRIKYLCKHGRCKRVCDLKILNREDGDEKDVILGTQMDNGEFLQSHFVAHRLELVLDSLVVEGVTPTAEARIELRFRSHHFLEGLLRYKRNGEPSKEFPIHAHLEASETEKCTEIFDNQRAESMKGIEKNRHSADEPEIRSRTKHQRASSLGVNR